MKKVDLSKKWFVVSRFYDNGASRGVVYAYDHIRDVPLFAGALERFAIGNLESYFIDCHNCDCYVDIFDDRASACAFALECNEF